MIKDPMAQKIIDHICSQLLGHSRGQRYPGVLTKKLQALSFYPMEVVWNTIEGETEAIQTGLQGWEYPNEVAKIYYIFSCVDNTINDYYNEWMRQQDSTQDLRDAT